MPSRPMRSDEEQRVVRLDWDSGLFGIEVGRIVPFDLSDDELAICLQQAQDAGLDVLYWTTANDRIPAAALLKRFCGQMIDQKATYAVRLASVLTQDVPQSLPFRIEEYPCGAASSALKSLMFQAGAHSRFRIDSRFPPHVFGTLYEAWIDRSTRREIADIVLTAVNSTKMLLGFIVLATAAGEANVTLLGVDESCRRMGVGRQLLNAAHRWVAAREIERVKVVTQVDNHEACTFYGQCGYQLCKCENIFHFWPQQSNCLP
jgi:dTDP-4-amino-4,6-dideoxy-D-galactose acyltransferase